MTTPAPWQRQPGETSAMFAAFNCYLALQPPRSVERAFRERYPEKAATKRKESGKILGANGTWHNWATGRTSKGVPIPNMPTWAQRAAALDDHLQALQVAEWERQHMSAAEAVARLSQQARGSIADFADVKTGADLKNHPQGHLVHKLETFGRKTPAGDIFTRVKIELYNAQRAAETMAKITGALSDQHVVTVKLEKEIDQILETAKQVLAPDDYNRLLARISGETDSPTSAE